MSLDEKVLRDKIVSKINGEKIPINVHNGFADSIKEHLIESCFIVGNYVGILPNGSPDPLNGEYYWSCIKCDISGKNILNAINGVKDNESFLRKFNNIISEEIKNNIFFERSAFKLSGIVLIGVPLTLDEDIKFEKLEVNMNMNSKPKNINETNLVIASSIVNAIKNAIYIPTITAKTLTGKGIVTFTKIL